MSQISEVLKNKNKVEKARRNRRKDEILKMKERTAFKTYLYDEFQKIDILLADNDVESVIISIPEKSIALFTEAMYSEDLALYEFKQLQDKPNEFLVKPKFLSL